MNRTKSIILILITFILTTSILSTIVLATPIDDFESSITTSGPGTTEVKTQAGKILGIIQVVGTIIAVGMLMVLGVKYMMGSADQKAEYRKTMIPYFIGAILIFAATNITDAIYSWAKGL